jgi:hypothetical protein
MMGAAGEGEVSDKSLICPPPERRLVLRTGVKWRNFKFVMVEQKYFTDPALPLGFPHIVKLITDPKEREPYNPVYLHTWTSAHFGRLLAEFKHSVAQEPLIPAGALLDFVPQH